MKNKEIISLLSNAAKGKSDFNKGAAGSDGFGFVFRNVNFMENYINLIYTSRICNVGTMRKFTKALQSKRVSDLLFEYSDISNDILCIGAIKTLIPDLEMPIDDLLFIVLMIVKTPDDKTFPATFYYGKTRLAIGGWNLDFVKSFGEREIAYPVEFQEYFNFNPFDFTLEQQNIFANALESTLQKIPTSDFEVVFRDDYGDSLIAIKHGVPLFRRIRDDEYWPIEIIDDGSWRYYDMFDELIENNLTHSYKTRIDYGLTSLEHETLRREVIERCYDDLVEFAHQQDSRLAFQVLGYLLMEDGAKMTDDLKRLILKNSRLKDERHNLKDKESRIKRRRQLLDFRAKILDYKSETIIS